MTSRQAQLGAAPQDRIPNSAGRGPAGLPGGTARRCRPAWGIASGLVDQRGGRRQPQPRVHRKGTTAELPSSRRCPMCAWSARAGRCRSRAAHYEHLALVHQARLAPGLVPAVLHHNRGSRPHRHGAARATHHHAQGTDFRSLLSPLRPIVISRPFWRGHCSSAPTWRFQPAQKKQGIAAFSGKPRAVQDHRRPDLLPHPYFQAEQNRWTAPWLDATAASFREGPRPARRNLAAQAQIHGQPGSN